MYVFTHCQKYTDKIDWTIQLSPVAQLVEQSAVNRLVTGSSPVAGAILTFECKFTFTMLK